MSPDPGEGPDKKIEDYLVLLGNVSHGDHKPRKREKREKLAGETGGEKERERELVHEIFPHRCCMYSVISPSADQRK